MSEIIDFKTRQEKKEETQEVKEERYSTISFLKELIQSLEKENLDPKDCIVMVSYEDSRDKIFNTQSHDMFHTDTRTRDMLALIELVKHKFLNDTNI